MSMFVLHFSGFFRVLIAASQSRARREVYQNKLEEPSNYSLPKRSMHYNARPIRSTLGAWIFGAKRRRRRHGHRKHKLLDERERSTAAMHIKWK
jgi:hypothetical protein